MPLPLYQVDAFADGPFTGNPAAVCVLDANAAQGDDAAWMQRVAEEMNLSETAFIEPVGPAHDNRKGDAATWRLRWFTPAAEVELCGHATLAAAHLLWDTGRVEPDAPIAFHTRFSGELACRREGELIAMDFPADRFDDTAPPPAALLEALGLHGGDVAAAARGRYDWLVELHDPDAVVNLLPDFAGLARFDTRGVAVTAWAHGHRIPPPGREPIDGVEVVSRFFAPRLRVNEDPVTGSLHCLFGPWYRRRRGVDAFEAYQASPRGGRLRVETRGQRVRLAGRAVTVTRGELLY